MSGTGDRTLEDLPLEVEDAEGLRDVLARLVDVARDRLGDDFLGAYLQGSLAGGDFEDRSDVDFIIVVREDVEDDRVSVLQAFHRSLFRHPSHWAQRLEGSYVPVDALATLPPPHRALLYLDCGSTTFERSGHDHYLAVLWLLRERGITLMGPAPRTWIPRISPEALRSEVRRTMREWGTSILTDPEEMTQRWYQTFAVLSYCRMPHTLQTGEVRSKRAGMTWAKRVLDRRWHGLIDRAWAERERMTEESHGSADPGLLARTRAFVRDVLERFG